MGIEEPILSESRPRPATRLQKSIRGALRWVLLALLAFGLGALLIALALYLPTRQKLDRANADLEHASVTISGNNDQITALQMDSERLQTDSESLQEILDSATLHRYVLEALSSVRGSSLAMAADNYAGARLSLIRASEALDTLSGLLGPDQKDVLNAMQQGAAQALAEVKSDLKSAQPALDQLTKNLVQLEDNLFPSP